MLEQLIVSVIGSLIAWYFIKQYEIIKAKEGR